MTTDELKALFETHHDAEFCEFGRVEPKTSQRRDLHTFLLLDRLVPGMTKMVSAAAHDEIWLDVDPEDLAEAATEAQVIELIRCGVRYDDENESLAMFV